MGVAQRSEILAIRNAASFEVEDEEFEEALGLLDHEPAGHHTFEEETAQGRSNSMRAWRWWIVTMVLVALWSHYLNSQAKHGTGDDEFVLFACPSQQKLPENVKHFEDLMVKDYEEISKELTDSNLTEFMSNLQESEFNDWDKTYKEFKDSIKDWKIDHYAPYLQNGSSIFESACGIGLNLYSTLEVLYEEAGIANVVVYGSEFVDASTSMANAIFERFPPAQAEKGRICTGDSTDLSYIPMQSFDLVFTGYLSTLLDPLNLKKGEVDQTLGWYEELCRAGEDDWRGQKLTQIAQQRQEDWFGKWVAEMSRIAKPGAPVIIEDVSLPLCQGQEGWGGVTQAWWKSSSRNNTYGWDVDPNSLEFGEDHLFDENRYHVFMRKKEMKP